MKKLEEMTKEELLKRAISHRDYQREYRKRPEVKDKLSAYNRKRYAEMMKAFKAYRKTK